MLRKLIISLLTKKFRLLRLLLDKEIKKKSFIVKLLLVQRFWQHSLYFLSIKNSSMILNVCYAKTFTNGRFKKYCTSQIYDLNITSYKKSCFQPDQNYIPYVGMSDCILIDSGISIATCHSKTSE